jgi:hypothetical protein
VANKSYKKILKRILRAVLRPIVSRVRNIVDTDDFDARSVDFSKDDIIYPRLNWLLEKSVRESQGRLRPNYTWALLHAGHLAKSLGMRRISAIEFGVAGGNGLVALEHAADLVEDKIGVKVDVYGFDTGNGLPPPLDYRDLPNLYRESAYRMDVDALKKRLHRAELVLGLVEETVPEFIASNPAPIGFMSIDVDYYTSTMDVFKVLDAAQDLLMPRIHCYVDDTIGFTFSEFTGERLAIAEFNDSHKMRKVSPIFGLKYLLPERYSAHPWCEQMYMAHIFDHPLYGQTDGLNVRVNEGHTVLAKFNLAVTAYLCQVTEAIPLELAI